MSGNGLKGLLYTLKFWVFLVCTSTAFAQSNVNQVVELGDQFEYPAKDRIQLLRDPQSLLKIDDIRKANDYFQNIDAYPALGYTRETVWFRLPIVRKQHARSEWVLKVNPSYLDSVELWLEQDGKILINKSIGRRDYGNSGYVVPDALQTLLDIPSGTSSLYMRVETATTLAMLPVFMAPDTFLQKSEKNSFRIGLIIGAMVFVFVFNCVCWWITKVGLYGLFAGYIGFGFFGLLEGAGIISSFYWSGWQYLTARPLSISLGFSWLFAYLFFLQLFVDKKKDWWLCYLYYALFIVAIAQIVSGVVGGNAYSYVTEVMTPLGITVTVLTLIPVWRLICNGQTGSQKLLGIAFLPHALFLIPNQLFVGGWLPPSLFSIFGQTQAGVLQIGILQVALLFRVKDLLQERKWALENADRVNAEVEREREIREEQSRFLSMITHEIRTPLAVVDMSVQSLRVLDGEPDEFRLTRYSRIQSAVKRMATLLELGLKKDDINGGIWQPDDVVDLTEISKKVISEFPVDQRGRIELGNPENGLSIKGNKAALKLTFFNLVENALKYSGDKKIFVSTGSKPGKIFWQVEDQGQGIPKEQREKVFEKFFRAGEHSGKPGLGLGLYISQQVVQRHEGRLQCLESRLGGACFRCEFFKSVSGGNRE
ncbi:sensor histidine kinase [Parendozoicomonas sp. Alg238-R29]|uniref:sensor histidine kinase n=1 Tax=Parendozoicomonas sp. Alg238-R29 TaxID=2993446 RepID=UPI00248D66A9|nr:sensor histidine kinase [Parendozoicomonas sp. Alg238-R29]